MKKIIFVAIFLFLALFALEIMKVENRQNFVIAKDKEIFVYSLDPKNKIASLLILPAETWLPVVENHGYYKAGSLLGLDSISGKKGELLTRSVEEFLAVPLDGFLVSWEFKPGVQEVANLFKGLKQTRMQLAVRKIKPEKMEIIDLGKFDVGENEALPDGDKILKIDQSRLDEISKKFFSDPEIRQENLTVSVLNATNFPGLAQAGSRYVANLGSQVVEVADWPEKIKICQLRAEKKLTKTRTYLRLKKTFSCAFGGEDKGGHRADLVLILAEDYLKKREGF